MTTPPAPDPLLAYPWNGMNEREFQNLLKKKLIHGLTEIELARYRQIKARRMADIERFAASVGLA